MQEFTTRYRMLVSYQSKEKLLWAHSERVFEMGPMYHDMVRFFLEDGWKFTPLEGKPSISLGFSGDNGSWNCFAHADDDRNQFIFYSICSMNVPETRRSLVAEYLTRANYGLIIGNFEMDWNDGEVRYKTSVDVGDGSLTAELIKPLVYINVAMMDKYLPGIMAVAYGSETPEDAVKRIEA